MRTDRHDRDAGERPFRDEVLIGPARIGPIETIGFDGPMTITSAAAMASTTAVGRPVLAS